MIKTDVPFISATDLSAKIRNRDISSVEATSAYLDRISEVDTRLNSYIKVCPEYALSRAEYADISLRDGRSLGILHGVPFAVKDQFWTEGIRTTGGSLLFKDFTPKEDATVVSRLKASGGILLGKLNMSEFATGNGVKHPYGVPRNPWSSNRIPGTSSSGSSAATAAFLCATSLGEDTGGSIRHPAHCCGLVGLRPTWGLVSRYGMMGASWSMDIAGPISRTVEDCALTLQAIAGYDNRDRHTSRAAVPNYPAELKGDIKGLRIGIVKEAMDSPYLEPGVKLVVEKAIAHLETLGVKMEEVSLPLFDASAVVTRVILAVEAAAIHAKWLRHNLDEYGHNVKIDMLVGALMPGHFYYKAQRIREVVRRQILDVTAKYDLLIMPTSSEPAPLIQTEPGLKSKDHAISRLTGRKCFTSIFNLANVPALSLPCGFVDVDGLDLPIGLQLAGRPFSEVVLLRVAYIYEKSTQWHKRRPPL